ncbi:tetratricopeptide repeat protein [Arenimonas daejeonensis]|uniref:tetratricopeptide repeat protein n=1 Tax=Arenimonas daejeonensis TaxID=370777 RepID=UPI00131580CA|nr:tetratricopeptide repeat protein [Arenimonas daejeonensis]
MPAYTDRIGWAESDRLVLDRGLYALTLDPLQPEPYAAMAMLFETNDATWEALLERAIALRPSFATAHQWLGTRLMARGRLDEGLAAMERASALDPRSAVIANNHAHVLLAAGRTADARQRCEQSLAITPDDVSCLQYLGIAALLLGDFDAARTHLRKLSEAGVGNAGDQPDRIIDALSGKGDRKAVARELAALPFNSNVIPGSGNSMEDQIVALVLVLLGEHALALDYVERISGELGNTMDWGVMLPGMDPIRCDPRFQAVVAKLGAKDPHAATVCAGG